MIIFITDTSIAITITFKYHNDYSYNKDDNYATSTVVTAITTTNVNNYDYIIELSWKAKIKS